jgi:transposase-like protein
MSLLSRKYFQDEKAAFEHLESLLWSDGVVCPHCGSVDSSGKLKGLRSKPSKKNPEGIERHGVWKCYAKECRKQFTVRVGTVFESAHIPLHKMLQAVYLMSASKKGISAHQLTRTLEVDYKSGWFLAHRIREAMRDGKLAPMGGEGKAVEAKASISTARKSTCTAIWPNLIFVTATALALASMTRSAPNARYRASSVSDSLTGDLLKPRVEEPFKHPRFQKK